MLPRILQGALKKTRWYFASLLMKQFLKALFPVVRFDLPAGQYLGSRVALFFVMPSSSISFSFELSILAAEWQFEKCSSPKLGILLLRPRLIIALPKSLFSLLMIEFEQICFTKTSLLN